MKTNLYGLALAAILVVALIYGMRMMERNHSATECRERMEDIIASSEGSIHLTMARVKLFREAGCEVER